MDKNIVTQNTKRRHVILGTVIKVKGRTVGQVYNGEFVKDITNRHMLTTPPAIANDIQALHDAERAGAEYCVFTNTDSGIVYRAAIAKIYDMGKRVNYGWGEQVALLLPNWTQTRDPQATSQTSAPVYEDPNATSDEDVKPLNIKSRAAVGVTFTKGSQTPKQLRMFGGGE